VVVMVVVVMSDDDLVTGPDWPCSPLILVLTKIQRKRNHLVSSYSNERKHFN
jgi:hypothetical protein